ncbi:Histidine--tRNA ligase [Solibacillus isronensis B3W22]|uniref:Histidine--tRNA ligase n=1 Tax=Solibacillus isronensis B3W22 TaxID=1224748 RepID=K1KRM2_9BACL|nr:histidine--tRNA ligase [Solibacillus isronensis]AMO86565.1 histidine--tRNA ligase [Solibacillus silvestris]EKB45146.1 Histidine--tRNA ligase [Solibacillus isronensis B3W22]
MKKMDYQNVKGTQDYLPAQEVVRRNIRHTLEDTFILYGCKPLETPILNYTKLMASKYAGGAEILKEMYTLTDRGERDLALRYDLTIPFAKVIAMNPQLSMPFKRYEIGKVFRDGPIKAGRFREFTQCDVDVVGIESQSAEAELMMMTIDAFNKLNIEMLIQFNNRKLLAGLLQYFKVPQLKINSVILILDKMEKIDQVTLLKELEEQNLSPTTIELIKHFLNANPTIAYFEKYREENELIKQGYEELIELQDYLQVLNVGESCVFNPFLARGLEIYTGTIYELFLKDGVIKSSIGGGGRYDNAIGGLIGSEEKFSTVGISFGLDVIYTAMEQRENSADQALVDIFIIPLNTEKEALRLAWQLRQQGNRVEVELSGKKLRKAMEKANRENIRKVIILGENEIHTKRYEMKDMQTGEVEQFEIL